MSATKRRCFNFGNSYPPQFEIGSLKTEEDEWLTTKMAAESLKISPKSLLNMVSNGSVKCHKLGTKRNRYLKSDLRKLLRPKSKGAIYGV